MIPSAIWQRCLSFQRTSEQTKRDRLGFIRSTKMAFSVLTVIFWPPALFFATIVLLYNLSNTFRFYFKVILFYVIVFVASTLSIPFACLKPFDANNTKIVSWFMLRFCSIYNIQWELRGSENLTMKGPGVIVCNHQSAIDTLGMMTLWPTISPAVPIVKKELKYALSFGVLATLCGTVYIDRVNPAKARETVNKTIAYLKSKALKVWFFPEGTRNGDGSMLPFKKGAFHMAIQGQLPIIPIVFSSYSDFYNGKKKIFRPGKVIVSILPPISTDGMIPENVNQLTDDVRTSMLEVFNATTKSLVQDDKESNGMANH